MSLKINALNQVALSLKLPALVVKNHYHAVALTLCPREGQYCKKDCIYRSCDVCGTALMMHHLGSVLEAKGNEKVEYLTWTKSSKPADDDQGSSKSRYGTVRVLSTVKQLVEDVCKDLETLSQHLFHAQWQSNQFASLRESVPKNYVVMVLDFAQNYACDHQDEVQAAHWTHNQVTVHPIVTYYSCNNCEAIVTESLVCISDDLQHDHHAVYKFVQCAFSHL